MFFFRVEKSPPANRFQQVPTGSNVSQLVLMGFNGSQLPTGSNRSQRVPTSSNGSHTEVCFMFLDFFAKKR